MQGRQEREASRHLAVFGRCWSRVGVSGLGALPAAPLPASAGLACLSERQSLPFSLIPSKLKEPRVCLKKMIFTRAVFGYGSAFICVFLLTSGGLLALASLLLSFACASFGSDPRPVPGVAVTGLVGEGPRSYL